MSFFEGKSVFITGASSGIGRALVHALVEQGALVTGVARRKNELDDLESEFAGKFTGIAADVSVQDNWKAIAEALPGLPDIVILNAGNCEYLEQGRVDAELVQRIFQVNFFANVYAAETLLNRYGKNTGFHWVTVSSSACFLAMPRGEAYAASKAALSYFFEALQLSYANARFSVVHPGFVGTPLTDKNDFDMPYKISSEKAAKKILDGIRKGKRQIDFPLVFTAMLRLLGMLPAGIRFAIGKRMVK